MADLSRIFQGGFNAEQVEPAKSRDFSLLPNGPYDVEITNAEVRETNRKDGEYLEVEHTVISPAQFAGRKVWARINLVIPSEEATKIGRAELSALCHAVGIPNLKDSDHLLQKLLRIRVGTEPASNGYPAKNKVTGWESHAGQLPPVSTQRPAANAPAAAAPAKKAPWAK